jgi:catechol 2,3-dioxygenase
MTPWTIGSVHLNVANLDQEIEFYQNTIGLRLHRRDNGTAYLGAGGEDLLILNSLPQGIHTQGGTGLYHFALRVPTRQDLATVLAHFAKSRIPLQGVSDHLVSEAIYLADPEGNGIEIYRDRPREQWPLEDGRITMATEAMDVDGVLGELTEEAFNAPYTGLPAGTDMGHVHLHVADIARAESFYHDLLGFDVVVRYGPSASFLSVDGYHHHIGINMWKRGQPGAKSDDSLGLRYFTLHLTPDHRQEAEARLHSAQVAVTQHEDGLLFYDPVGNGIVLLA